MQIAHERISYLIVLILFLVNASHPRFKANQADQEIFQLPKLL